MDQAELAIRPQMARYYIAIDMKLFMLSILVAKFIMEKNPLCKAIFLVDKNKFSQIKSLIAITSSSSALCHPK